MIDLPAAHEIRGGLPNATLYHATLHPWEGSAIMQSMRARRFVLLLLLYVSLDFANPLMPGAVQFIDGSFSVVNADRVRPETPSVDATLIHVPAPGPTELALEPAPHYRPLVRDQRPHLVLARRPLPAPPDPASPSEDH